MMWTNPLRPPDFVPRRTPFDFPGKPKYPFEPAIYQRTRKKDVTVCAACICDHGKAIVAVCDAKISAGYTSSDRATLKAVRVSQKWAFMYAATDVSPVVPIRQKIREGMKTSSNRLDDVALIFRKAFQDQVSVQASELHQVPQETALGLFLVGFGFDDQAKPHIFTTCDPQGKTDYHDILGFQTAGTGGPAASSMLYFFGQTPATSLPLTIYHASAAKFMAESASDVGKHTSLLVLKPSGQAVFLLDPEIDSLRTMWDVDGKPHLPINASDRISRIYSEAETLSRISNQARTMSGLTKIWSEDED